MSSQLPPPNTKGSTLTPLDNFRVVTNQTQVQQPQQASKKQTQPNTTNLTLNMNFNLQQSTIQLQQVPHQAESRPQDMVQQHQRIFHSPRQSQGTMQTLIQQQAHQFSMTPQHYTKQHLGNGIHRDITPKKGMGDHGKLASLNRSEDSEKIGSGRQNIGQASIRGSVPIDPSSKVKKMKISKLSKEQLNQIRSPQTKITSASLGSKSHHQIFVQEVRTSSVGNNSAQPPQNKMQQLYAQQAQQMASNGQYINKITVSQEQAQQLQTASYYRGNPSSEQRQPSDLQLQTREQSESMMGRKGERPTVAQILEIGVSSQGQNWVENESSSNQYIQMQRQQLQPMVMQHQPAALNSTLTSNFQSINNSQGILGSADIPNTVKTTSKAKAQNMGHFFEEIQMGPGRNQSLPIELSEVNSGKKKAKNQNKRNFYNGATTMTQPQQSHRQAMQSGIYSPSDSSRGSIGQSQMRQMHKKMHQGEGGGSRNHQVHHYTQQQDLSQQQLQHFQAGLMPLLLDMNHSSTRASQGNSPATASTNQQLFARAQQQFMDQNTLIRHPQMGELPVISMTQQQLNSMIQQAQQQRQNIQYQTGLVQPQFQSQESPVAPGISQPQMAFAIHIDDQPQASKTRNHVNQTLQQTEAQIMHAEQCAQSNGIFLPILRQQNQLSPMKGAIQTPQSQTMPSMSFGLTSPQASNGTVSNSGNYLVSQAPIKKMTLMSRGKSVPRSSVRLDAEHNQGGLLETIQNPQSRQREFVRQQQQQFNSQKMRSGDFRSPPAPMISVGNLTTSFLSPHGREMPDHQHQGDYPDSQGYQMIDSQKHMHQLQSPITDQRKGAHDSVSTRGGDSSGMYTAVNGNGSVQSRRPPINGSHSNKYAGVQPESQRQKSRNLVTQSDRSSQRAGTQHSQMVNVVQQQQFLAQKGPLSDLIMTQQSNLNVPRNSSSLRKGKRNQSSITVNTTQDQHHLIEPPESINNDVNGGIPYFFENAKLNQAIQQEEQLRQTGMQQHSQNAPDFDYRQHQQLEQTQEQKKTKKLKGRKDKNLPRQNSKVGVSDATKFGNRQFSNQPPTTIAGMVQQLQQSQQMPPKPDKKGRPPQYLKVPASMAVNQEMVGQTDSTSGASYQQQQQIATEQQAAQQAALNNPPQNLKPNFALKRSPTKKFSDTNRIQGAQVAMADISGASEHSLASYGVFTKNCSPACTKYFKSKNNSRMTPHKYRNGISTRLLVAKETFQAKRAKLPIMILNLDGVLGYFDESKNYVVKEKCLTMLQSLSQNFKIVAFSSESRGLITRFGKSLSEFKIPFAFDAVYQIQRKPTQNQNRVNLTHMVLDFSNDEDEDLDLFVCSQIVLVTVDRQNLSEKFETMDLREVIDFDKEYLKGAKAPIIIRTPHARCRPNGSTIFETLFQVLTCLLVSSKLGNMETSSFFTYNDRTKGMSIPSADKQILAQLVPEKIKFVDKAISSSKSLRFVMTEPQFGLNLHKGFKQLTEVFKGAYKPDWLEFNYRIYKPLLPIRMRLQKITQIALQGAQPPSGKKLIVRFDNEEATRKYQIFGKKNEGVKKHIRKYRARYWAVNQIEDTNLEEENQDIVGDLLDNGIVANTLGALGDVQEPLNTGAETAEGGPTKEGSGKKEPDEEEKLAGGACSSSSEASDSEGEQYDEEATAVKFKVIDIKLLENEGPALRKQQTTVGKVDQHRIVKIEMRKNTKSRHQFLLDFCSKKQNTMLFTTNQQQHLQGAQAQQVESAIQELVQKLNDAEKAGKKEVVNYDF